MSIGAGARTVALGGVVIISLGACGGGISSASRLSAGIARNPGWTHAQLKSAYADWTGDVNREMTNEVPALPGDDAGDDDGGRAPSENEPPQVSRPGLTEARRVLLLCEFNTATQYVTYADFQTMDVVQRRELRQSVRQACLA